MKSNPKKFKIEYEAKITSLDNSNDIMAWMVKPSDSDLQKIEHFSVSQEPKDIYTDQQGNEIMYFLFKDQKSIILKAQVLAILWKRKVDLKIKNISASGYPRYTKSERFLEQTLEIKKIAKEITKKDKLVLDKVRSIFNFVTKNFKYQYPVKKRGVSHLNLKDLQGDCAEYSSLFVAMCRSLKIPARNNTGFVIFPKQKSISEHGWASIYLKPYGWVNVDTQYASLEKSIEKMEKYFISREDYRITFTNGFNIPLKPTIPKDFYLEFWNDLGLPMDNNSVQTLQPFVFASNKNTKFKDDITLIK